MRIPDLSCMSALIPDGLLLLLCDVLPTGYFAAQQALQHPNLQYVLSSSWLNTPALPRDAERILAIAIVGLGPVGMVSMI